MLYELCIGQKPFEQITKKEKASYIINHQPNFSKLEQANRNIQLVALIKLMLQKVPENRPTTEEVLSNGQSLYIYL